MKTHTVTLVVFIIFTQVTGYLIKMPKKSIVTSSFTDNTQWVHVQELMIPLFENICEVSKNSNITRLAQDFTFNPADYMKPEVITNLENLVASGLLPKGIIFSDYNPDHLKELKIVYEVLYNAKDFNTFYKVAAWARQNLNCMLYVTSIYMAIQNRKDTEKVYIPAPYELIPNYFINQQVILQAAKFLMKDYDEYIVPNDSIHNEGDSYIIDANYTAMFYDNDDESKLAYFREDIGLNSYYFLKKLRMATWFNSENNEYFGENMLQMMKQLMARYNLERYANGLPELDGINWDAPINIPYDSMLIYSNGVEFGHRKSLLMLSESEDLSQIKAIEGNLLNIVTHMHQRGYNKRQILNHLMEILVMGDRSYESLARQLIGKDVTNNGETCVLEHYMTSLRDPMFWKVNMKIVNMIDEALKILPSYTRNELFFPGVEVTNIEVKKMMTTYDYFTFDVTDALKIEETGFRVKIGQPRLNHKQFSLRVNISSLVSQKGVMKIYLGPKFLPGELVAKKNLFTLIDTCEINLKIGSNLLTRSPNDMKYFSDDFMQLNSIRKKVEYSNFGLNSWQSKTISSQAAFPSRFILPKGTSQGLTLQMFIIIAPFYKTSLEEPYSQNSLKFNAAILSPGYPLDLMIQQRQLFELPNTMIKYVTVVQKEESKIENYGGQGITKSWYKTNTYDPSVKSGYNSNNRQHVYKNDDQINEYNINANDITSNEMRLVDSTPTLNIGNNDYYSKREPFDYRAKKAQYNKEDYSERNFTKKYSKLNEAHDYTVSTATNEIISTTDNEIFTTMNINRVVNTAIEMKILNKSHIAQEDYFKVEPLPLPAMLINDVGKGDKFNYETKKTERNYKIKEKKKELDQLIKDAKKRRYSSNRVEDQVSKDNFTVTESGEFSSNI